MRRRFGSRESRKSNICPAEPDRTARDADGAHTEPNHGDFSFAALLPASRYADQITARSSLCRAGFKLRGLIAAKNLPAKTYTLLEENAVLHADCSY